MKYNITLFFRKWCLNWHIVNHIVDIFNFPSDFSIGQRNKFYIVRFTFLKDRNYIMYSSSISSIINKQLIKAYKNICKWGWGAKKQILA